MLNKGIKLAVTALLLSAQAFAVDLRGRTSDLESQSWKLRELQTQIGVSADSRQDYQEAYSKFVKESRQLAQELVAENQWKEFSAFYKELDDLGKQNFELVVKGIIQEAFRSEDYLSRDLGRAQEYFPGYGYAKPGYVYRRGQELDRQFLYAYWKEEQIEESASMVKELTIEISLLANFQLEFPKLEILEKLNIQIEGKIYECVKIKIEKSKKIVTKQQRKFGYEKVWFELFEAKKVMWGEHDWKKVGKTFQHDNTPSGEAVVTSATFAN